MSGIFKTRCINMRYTNLVSIRPSGLAEMDVSDIAIHDVFCSI